MTAVSSAPVLAGRSRTQAPLAARDDEHHGPPLSLIALGGMLIAGMALLMSDGLPAGNKIAGGAGLVVGAGLAYAGVKTLTTPAPKTGPNSHGINKAARPVNGVLALGFSAVSFAAGAFLLLH
jgi:hypothetical protein